jgi:NAD+ kinase
MKVIGLIANNTKPRAAEMVRAIETHASVLGLNLLADEATAALSEGVRGVLPEALFEQAEAIVALGGDGTMLRAVRALDGRDTPVMGINIGGLGFLTSVSEAEMDQALRCLSEGNFVCTEMSVAACSVSRGGRVEGVYRGLNDVVISLSSRSRVARLGVTIDGDYLTSYLCDGLIVATPAGSTGHSMSAGGPILTPRAAALVISAICPHALSARPLVVPDSSIIEIRPEEADAPLVLSVDGQVGEQLDLGDIVTVRRSDRNVRFVRLPGHSHFALLRQKLRWSGSSV